MFDVSKKLAASRSGNEEPLEPSPLFHPKACDHLAVLKSSTAPSKASIDEMQEAFFDYVPLGDVDPSWTQGGSHDRC